MDRMKQIQHIRNNYKSINDFQLDRTLGTGSFGRVLLGRTREGEHVAIKVMTKERIFKSKQVEHVHSEKSLLAEVVHPFLVNLLAWFQDSRALYLVLDFVAGCEMFTHLHMFGSFPPAMARFYAVEVALGLEFLHKQMIIYRDLKPENLLLTYDGHVKITDFGFAKRIEEGRTWTVCGTPEYLAPEIIVSKGYSLSVDWWALGVLIYEMLTGHAPFVDENPMGIYEKIMAGRIYFDGQGFTEGAEDLISRLCTKDLTMRLGNMKNGFEDIRTHRWFDGVDWDLMEACKVKPPFLPRVSGPGDASNFDVYPEEQVQGLPELEEDLYAQYFVDF
eukprot:Nk52_evm1s2491 gene=Nk52_evmTU1s2491